MSGSATSAGTRGGSAGGPLRGRTVVVTRAGRADAAAGRCSGAGRGTADRVASHRAGRPRRRRRRAPGRRRRSAQMCVGGGHLGQRRRAPGRRAGGHRGPPSGAGSGGRPGDCGRAASHRRRTRPGADGSARPWARGSLPATRPTRPTRPARPACAVPVCRRGSRHRSRGTPSEGMAGPARRGLPHRGRPAPWRGLVREVAGADAVVLTAASAARAFAGIAHARRPSRRRLPRTWCASARPRQPRRERRGWRGSPGARALSGGHRGRAGAASGFEAGGAS